MTYQLQDLPYDFSALEPVISAKIMELHYTKHHQGYVTNLNAALDNYHAAEERRDLAAMVALEPLIRFHGGGHINHTLFWENLTPVNTYQEPSGNLSIAIRDAFGSLSKMVETMSAKTVAIQGSGWGWLGYCKNTSQLKIATCANQDPLSIQGLIPLLGIDVWEHAYYLQYQNVRAEYVKKIWSIIAWKEVEKRFAEACK